MYEKEISKLIALAVGEGLSESEIENLLVPPKDISLGDICMPCFRLAKAFRKNPVAIAEELATKIEKPSFISEIKAVSGYLNFKFSASSSAKLVIEEVLEQKDKYGCSTEGEGKTICIDYSSVNICKPLHMGHLSTTVIGAALYRIHKALGYDVVGINHLGDWGTQFGKMIVAFKLWGDKDKIDANGVKALHEIYVKYHQEAEINPSLDDEARAWFKKIEDGDSEAIQLYNWFKEVTLKEVNRVFDRLEVPFDSYNGEAFYNDKMAPVLDRLKDKGLLKESEGAQVVEFEDMPPCLLVKKDGATLYATRDLAAAYYRKATYNFYKCLYVVAYQQNLHFKQFFKVLELAGEPWAKDMHHVSFGMVSLEEGSMSTRSGNVVYLEDVINKAVDKARSIVEEKNPTLTNKEEVAEMVGVGSVVFSALVNGRIKDIVFSYDKVLNFEGETCPYVQYTYARCSSLLARAGEDVDFSKGDYSVLDDDNSKELVRALSEYKKAVKESAEKFEPYLVTRSVLNICGLFNKFYFENRILNAPEGVKEARLALTSAVRTVIKNGFGLLGIKVPEKM